MPGDHDIYVRPADAVGQPAPQPASAPSNATKHQADSFARAEAKIMQNAKEFYRGFEQQKLPIDFDPEGRSLRKLYAAPTYEQQPDRTLAEKTPGKTLHEGAKEIREKISYFDADNNQDVGYLAEDLNGLGQIFQGVRTSQAQMEQSQHYDWALRGFSQDRQGNTIGVPVIEQQLKTNFNNQINQLKELHNEQIQHLVSALGQQASGDSIDSQAANLISAFATAHHGIPGGKAQELLDELKNTGVSNFALEQTESLLMQQDDARQTLLASYNAQIERTNKAISERVLIEQARESSNFERYLSARHMNMLDGFENHAFRGDQENIDADTIREGRTPLWYQQYNETRKNDFATEGRQISADVVTEPSLKSGNKGRYGQFIVTHQGDKGITFSLQINPGTPKKQQIVMWGRKLAKEAPNLAVLNLTKLKARFGAEGVEEIAKQILAVNPRVKFTGITLSSAVDKNMLHATWCGEHNLSPYTPNPIAKLALDPADIFPRNQQEKDHNIHVNPPQPPGDHDIHVALPQDPPENDDEIMVNLPPFNQNAPAGAPPEQPPGQPPVNENDPAAILAQQVPVDEENAPEDGPELELGNRPRQNNP